MERERRRSDLAQDILLKIVCPVVEGYEDHAENMAKRAVAIADALLAELARPKEGA